KATKASSIGKKPSGHTELMKFQGLRGHSHAGQGGDRGRQHGKAEGVEKRGDHGTPAPYQGRGPGGPPGTDRGKSAAG
ncbi:Ferrous iron transport protein A, partial [Dysosmobacter welbionis]